MEDAFVILDEAQNTTPEQMKMFLTRMGFGSKMVVNGDVTQIDLPRGITSGLNAARTILKGISGIGIVEFSAQDVVRSDMVAKIIRAYERRHHEEFPGKKGSKFHEYRNSRIVFVVRRNNRYGCYYSASAVKGG